VYFLGVKAAGA